MEANETSFGISLLGSIVAACLSASINHSFWWGLLHFLLGWFYVIYALIVHSAQIFS